MVQWLVTGKMTPMPLTQRLQLASRGTMQLWLPARHFKSTFYPNLPTWSSFGCRKQNKLTDLYLTVALKCIDTHVWHNQNGGRFANNPLTRHRHTEEKSMVVGKKFSSSIFLATGIHSSHVNYNKILQSLKLESHLLGMGRGQTILNSKTIDYLRILLHFILFISNM